MQGADVIEDYVLVARIILENHSPVNQGKASVIVIRKIILEEEKNGLPATFDIAVRKPPFGFLVPRVLLKDSVLWQMRNWIPGGNTVRWEDLHVHEIFRLYALTDSPFH